MNSGRTRSTLARAALSAATAIMLVAFPWAASAALAAEQAKARAHAPADTGPMPGAGGAAPAPVIPGEIKLHYGPFGEVTVYQPAASATSIALFVSGDGGWNLGVVDMARHLMSMNAIVVGIDIRNYLKQVNAATETCRNFAVDFENLAHEVQRRLKLQDYLPPVLVGYSSGATLVYATAVQSPKGTFAGALSLGFCPDLAVTQKLCKGSGLDYEFEFAKAGGPQAVKGVMLAPSKRNATPWIAFQGDIDQVCDANKTRSFVSQTENARIVWLPKVGHGFSVERNWLPQFKSAYAELARPVAPPQPLPELGKLPLVAVPATASPAPDLQELFAVLLTGDGGWAGLDQDVAAALAARGIPVVGLNSLRYFWRARTPEAAAADLERIISNYGRIWRRPKVLLIGYSFGADVLPFLYTRLPEAVRASVRSVNLLGPGNWASFEIRVTDWIPGVAGPGPALRPEIERMKDASILCLYGAEEHDSPCPGLANARLRAMAIGGGHHFGGDYEAIARSILEHAVR